MSELWMQTHTGKRFEPSNPMPEMICIEDIAHALSQVVRFGGHGPERYTVAQHSILVARRAMQLEMRRGGEHDQQRAVGLWGLLHDASEAYLQDIPSPVKALLPDYRAVEASVMRAVTDHFGLDATEPDVVKQADRDLVVTEAAVFFPAASRPGVWTVPGENLICLHSAVIPLRDAEEVFLAAFRALT